MLLPGPWRRVDDDLTIVIGVCTKLSESIDEARILTNT